MGVGEEGWAATQFPPTPSVRLATPLPQPMSTVALSSLPFGIVGSQFAGKRVHFVGIGGSGMSGLARILIDSGAIVSGTEPKPSHVTFQLMQLGAKINHVQDGELISAATHL